MTNGEIMRKDLDNQQFMNMRESTQRISNVLDKRLKGHLAVLRSLFIPRKLLGTYIKSALMEEVSGSDKAFAELQEKYAAICEKPFGLSRKLPIPIPPISNILEATPFKYSLNLEGSQNKTATITCPTRWILSYQSECNLDRLRAMIAGVESRQEDDMRIAILHHLAVVVFLKKFAELNRLLEDLRYSVEVNELADLGGLPVVILNAPVATFLPPDDFITQITQLSGIPAFQEIIDLDVMGKLPDPLKSLITGAIE